VGESSNIINTFDTKLNYFHLDTMATVSLTNDTADLNDINLKRTKFINASGDATVASLEGRNNVSGRTLLLESAPMKIASFSEVIQSFTPEWDDQKKHFKLYNRLSGKLEFVAPLKDKSFPIMEASDMYMCAVTEVKGLSKSMSLHYRLNHQNAKDIHDAVQCGHYKDVFTGAVVQQDIQQCILCSLAKDTRLTSTERGTNARKRTKVVDKVDVLEQIPQEIRWDLPFGAIDTYVTMDVVFVVGTMYLTGVVQPIGYSKTVKIRSTKGRELIPTCDLFCKTIASASGVNKITHAMFDRESAINETDFVSATGVALRQSIPDVHNQTFEARMRPFRNQWRCTLLRVEGKLPMTKSVKELAWEYTIEVSNYLMTPRTKPFIPKQLLFWENDIHGLKVGTSGPNYHTPCEFGAYVIVQRRVETNKSVMRRQVGIVLGLESSSRAVLVRFPDSNKLFPRHAYRLISDEIGANLWKNAKTQVEFVTNQTEDFKDDDDLRAWRPTDELLSQPDNEENQVEIDDIHHMGGEMLPDFGEIEGELGDEMLPDMGVLDHANIEGELGNEHQDAAIQGELANNPNEPELRRSSRATRSTRSTDFVYEGDIEYIQALRTKSMLYDASDVGLDEPIHKTMERVMSLADDISQEDKYEADSKLNSVEGKDASVKLELFRVWKKYGAFRLVKLTRKQKTMIKPIKSRLFSIVKENENSGEFIKNKSRLVGRGDQRKFKPTDTLETFSPTFAFQTFLIVLNIILFLKLSWCVVDVESAYLYAPMAKGKDVHMSLSKNVVKHMLEIDPSIKEFINDDGTVDVLLLKALYGLQESAKLWYDEITEKLKTLGFQVCSYDRCLFYQWKNGKLSLILLYVDDMLLGGSDKELEYLKLKIEESFKVKSQLNPHQFSYVGTYVEYNRKEHVFLLSQDKFAQKVCKGVTGESDVPCTSDLFKPDESSPLLKDVTPFRSGVMELQYLSRTRLDIKPALSYLTTRVQSPTESDSEKLFKVKQYIKSTGEIKFRIDARDLVVHGSADASYANHPDYKSNSGVVVAIGPNVITGKSSKQKVVANSSTAAEIIALSAVVEEVLWTIQVLSELGFPQDTVVIEQDNKSTIMLAEKGPSGQGRTKWYHVKYFWIKEFLDDGTISLKYVPSREMVTDGFTKVLSKTEFKRWRARIMNIK
jgi:hypothetical protein